MTLVSRSTLQRFAHQQQLDRRKKHGKGARLPNAVQLSKLKSCFAGDQAYLEFTRNLAARVGHSDSLFLILDDETVLFGATAAENSVSPRGGGNPTEVILLSNMKHLFCHTDDGYRRFIDAITIRIQENGPNVLLLDDDRVLFRVITKGDVMDDIRRSIAKHLVSKPESLLRSLDRMGDTRKVDAEKVEW